VTSVAPARALPDAPSLEHRHAEGRLALAQGDGGPQPGVTAADDGDVGLGVADEGRRRRLGKQPRLLDPPGRRVAGLDGGERSGHGVGTN
jgi:hypothetical protein